MTSGWLAFPPLCPGSITTNGAGGRGRRFGALAVGRGAGRLDRPAGPDVVGPELVGPALVGPGPAVPEPGAAGAAGRPGPDPARAAPPGGAPLAGVEQAASSAPTTASAATAGRRSMPYSLPSPVGT